MPVLPALNDSEGALRYLSGFPLDTAIRGEAYVRQARVLRLDVRDPGRLYETRVLGSRLYEVSLSHTPDTGWSGRCSCPLANRCKHVYASLRVLLNRSGVNQPVPLPTTLQRPPIPIVTPTVAAVSRANQPVEPVEATTTASGKPTKSPRAYRSPLHDKLSECLGRELNKTELDYVKKVDRIYHTFQYSRYLNNWDCESLGLHIGELRGENGRPWTEHVRNSIEFWQLLAAAARRGEGSRVPSFMSGVTDRDAVEARIAEWERATAIEGWRSALNRVSAYGWKELVDHSEVSREVDLRLIIGERQVGVEIQLDRESKFKPAPQRRLEELAKELDAGAWSLVPEAESLWTSVRQRILNEGSLNPLNLAEAETRHWLAHLLRPVAKAQRVLAAGGLPWQRESVPLRWDLTREPARTGKAGEFDYQLRLVQGNGSPVPALWAILEGRPHLYVSADTLFTGPPWPRGLFPDKGEHRIPATVLETPAGLHLLHRLGAPLPENLTSRIKHVPFQVEISAEIQPIHPQSTTEDCVLTIRARSTNGKVLEVWDGRNWVDGRRKNPWSASKSSADSVANEDAEIILFDRRLPERIPALLAPLDAKVDGISNQLRVRINRQFPEKFSDWLKSLPPELTVILKGELDSLLKNPVAGSVELEATETETDWFDLKVILNVDDTSLSPEEIQLLLAAKGGFVRLKGKGWSRLKYNFTAEDDESLARLGLSARELSDEPQRLHALQLSDPSARRFLPTAQAESIERRASELKARVTPDIPTVVRAELRPYQLDGFHFLAYLATNRFGGILADDMGLGKTLQTITWLAWLRDEAVRLNAPPSPTLVVCPKSVVDNWRSETLRFTPSVRIRTWRAAELSELPNAVAEADIHVLNYSQLRLIGAELQSIRWLAVILDEGQYIKNPTSQTAQMACALKAKHRLILSGTPIENRLLDLWSLLNFAMPGVLGSRAQFNKLYDDRDDPLARRRLASRVRPFLLRRTKSQVAQELPARIEEDMYCELEGEQEQLYRAELKRAQQILLKIATNKQLAEHRFHLLTSLLRLRQICCHPALLLGTGSVELPAPESSDAETSNPEIEAPVRKRGRPKKGSAPSRIIQANSAKQEALFETLENIVSEGAKVLVFSQFVGLLELLQPALQERGWKFFTLTGETEDRGDLVQEFQSHIGPAVFLISLKAGGAGLNLTAATYVILFDPWWNPAVENQAIDRTHRIGQTQRVVAYRLLMKDTIEEKIRALQKSKSALADDVLGEEKFSQSLTLSDLKYLLAD